MLTVKTNKRLFKQQLKLSALNQESEHYNDETQVGTIEADQVGQRGQ